MADMLPIAVFFLSPWTALATLAGAASIPVIIHLLNRKRYRVVPWAAMQFLLNAQRRTVRKLRIEQWLLLVLRVLLIVLLVLAMISVMPWLEPLWNRLFPGGIGKGPARAGRTHRIIVIDGSFSMGRVHADGTSFERAKRMARQIVEGAAPGDGFSLLLASAPMQAIVPGPSDHSANVANEIDQLRMPHGNSDLAGTLTALDRIVSQPLGKYEQREIYLLTDLQRTLFQGRGLTPVHSAAGDKTAEPDAWQRLRANASVVWIDVAHEAVDNLAVTHLELGESLTQTGSLNSVTAHIHNFGSSERLQLRVDLLVGRGKFVPGEEANESEFHLRNAEQQLVNVPAGASARVTFPLKFSLPGEYVVQVRIEGDALPLDDSRSLVVIVKNRIPVMLVNGKPAADRDEQATHHLATALNPQPKSAATIASPFETRVLTEAQFADPSLGDLEKCDCVFLCDVARLNESKIKRLEAFLKRGGGVVFTLGGEVDVEAYNRLLDRGGEGILPANLIKIERANAEQVFNLAADDEAFKLPPLAAFADDNDRATLLSARFRQYMKVEPHAKSAARKILSFLSPSAGNGVGLDPAVLEWKRYRGRVFLITTSVNLDWGSWPGSPAFLPFMHELARHAAIGSVPRTANANEPLQEIVPIIYAGTEATIHTPDGRTLSATMREQDDVGILPFPDTAVSGIYRAQLDARREHLFAINVPATTSNALASESDLSRFDPAELPPETSDWLQIVSDPGEIQVRRNSVAAAEPTTAPKSTAGPGVARALLLIFLVLLLVELLLAWRFGSARTAALPDGALMEKRVPLWRRIFRLANLGFAPFIVLAALGVVLLHEAATGNFLGFLPAAIRGQIELALGVPAASPGEGTRWKLEYLAYITGDARADRWLAGLVLLAVCAGVIAVYQFERIATRIRVPGEPPRSGSSLVGPILLRAALFSLTLIVLLPQLKLLFEREGWPDVAIVYDTSQSFGAADDFQDSDTDARAKKLEKIWAKMASPQVEAAKARIAEIQQMKSGVSQAERLAALDQELAELQALLADLQTKSRLNLAKALTVADGEDWVTALLQQRQVKVHVYRCDAKTQKIGEVVDAAQVAEILQQVRELRPTGDASQLGSGVRTVLSDFRGASLGAVIFVTDGVVTDGEDLVQAARAAARSDVPLYLVGIGDAHEPRDLVLHDLQAEDFVNVRDRLIFELRVSKKGQLDVSTIPVVLSEKKANGDLVELKRETVALDPAKPVKVRLSTTPTEAGEKTYVISIPIVDQEVDQSNNRLERRVTVADARPVKVLYIEGFPHHDFRFIKTLLEREAASKQGNRSILLKVLLADADRDFAQQDKSAISEFPSREELFAYDAVILGDVDPKHARLGERSLLLLRDFVRERGGGLLCLAGVQEFMPNAYKDTPLADVLPVIPADDEVAGEKAILDAGLHDGYRPVLTPVGQQHPIFRFVTDDAQNAEIWQQLPPMYFAASRYRLKNAAEVLATHPSLPARHHPTGSIDGPELHPLIVQQFVGAGRVLFFGFNETSRWRYREFEIRFNQFWIQSVRYLARSKIGRIDLHLDKQTPYRRNEPIRVSVRFPDDAPAPSEQAPVKVVVERSRLRARGESTSEPLETQTLSLTKVKASRAAYEALLTRTPEGEYKFWLASPTVEARKPETTSRVLPPPGELDRIRLDRAVLEQAAKESRGKFYTLADVDSLIDDLPAGTRIALNQPRPPWLIWNHALLFLLVISLLTSEWILRKRNRLL